MSVLQTCKHPTVVEYIESLMHDNHLFIIMELMDGGSLTNLIQVSPSPDRWPAHPSRVRVHTGLPGPSQALRPPPPPHTHTAGGRVLGRCRFRKSPLANRLWRPNSLPFTESTMIVCAGAELARAAALSCCGGAQPARIGRRGGRPTAPPLQAPPHCWRPKTRGSSRRRRNEAARLLVGRELGAGSRAFSV